jgi:hypothetical protein
MNKQPSLVKVKSGWLGFGRGGHIAYSGFRFLKDADLRRRVLSNCLYISLSFVFLFSLYTLGSNTFWPRFLHAEVKGLSPIGQINSEAGQSARKTRIDSLWLPVFQRQIVYNADMLSTEKNSTIEIELTKELRFSVEPKSLVRIRMLDGKPLLRLSKGEIKTDFSNDQTILIKKGPRIEEVLIRKGTYLIKNDISAGIQITSFTQDIKSTSSLSEQNRTKVQQAGDDFAEEAPTKKSAAPAQEEVPHQVYDLPTPQDGTVFLLKGSQSIVVGAKAYCSDRCTLKIYRDQHEVKALRFSKGEFSVGQLESDETQSGQYSWSFSSDNFEHKSVFSILELTDQNLEQAISNGQPVEVLGE